MAQDLNLQVLLKAVDKATKPLRQINQSSEKAAAALKASRGRLRELNQAQKRLDGFRELKRGSDQTADSLREQQRRVADLTREIRETDGPTKRLNQSRDKAIRQARQLKQRYEREQQQMADLRQELKRTEGLTGTFAEQQRELKRRVSQSTTEIRQQEHALSRVARRQKAAADAARRYGRMQSRASGMVTSGAGGMAAGGAALYGAGRLLRPGIDYGEQTSELQAVLRLQKDSAELAELNAQSRALGSSTQFSATEAAAGQTFLARAGFTPAAIRASMQDVLDLALAGGLELGRAADISSNIAGVFKIDTEAEGQMRHLADVLTATSTRANVNIEMLGSTMKYLGQAEGLDVTMEQAAAMAGLLGNMGLQGTQAGTTLRSMMSRLAAPTKAARAALDDLGVSAADSDGNLRPIPAILSEIAQATRDMGSADRASLLGDIFTQESVSGITQLIDQQGADGISRFSGLLADAAGENSRVAQTMADNIGGDLKSLNSAWEEVGISITDVNDGPLRNLIGNITAITRGVGGWIKENPKLASTLTMLAGGIAGLVALGGTLTFMLGSIIGPIALARYGLSLLGIQGGILSGVIRPLASRLLPLAAGAFRALGAAMFANPIGLIITGITLLAGAAYLLYRNWDSVAAWFSDRWTDIKTAFDGGIAGVARLLLNWNPFGLLYRGIVAALEALGVQIPEQFSSLGGAIVDGLVGGLYGSLGKLKDAITGMGSKTIGWFKDKLGIHSPSRVFASFGMNTVQGFAQGIAGNESQAISQIGRFSDRVRQAGAGLALAGALAGPGVASASAPAFSATQLDQRAPMAAPAGAGGVTVQGGINIEINAAPGMDEQALAAEVRRQVQAALADANADRGARRRSSLFDQE